MKPKVSILVPVYNVSMYVERCAYSIFNQTFKEIEYIFVDDATPDDSIVKIEAIIEKLNTENRDLSTKIISHKTNKGLAASRISALKAALGDYILFIDSDDYIEPDMVETMYNKAKNSGAEIVICDLLMEYTDKTFYFEDYLSPEIENRFINMITGKNTSPSLCNKLIKSHLFCNDKLEFNTEIQYMEDRYLTIRLFYFTNNIYKINRAFYHYIHYNQNSITIKFNELHFKHMILYWETLESFLKKNNDLEKYSNIINASKLKDKYKLLFAFDSKVILKKYATIFAIEEAEFKTTLKIGEKILRFLIRNNLFIFIPVLKKLIKLKSHIL